ncbi:hypothetical protein SUGI_0471370 [Cryptomeria japonica]|nr:hypothetical protein SUGI_0471370 [Cryptomeria japonica]
MIVESCVQIYPYARGFYVVVFQNVEGRNKVLGGSHWCWEDSHPLMLKPWHPAFNLESESFDRTPVWIRLPNLPMQFWFDSYFEAIGNSLDKFLMTDDDSLNLLHTTFAHLVVEIDVSRDLPSEISISSSKSSWLQSVDYEGIPFRCRRCFKTGHNVDSCARRRVKQPTSWWKEVTPQFYMVDEEGGPSTPQDMGGLIKDTSEKAVEPTNNMQGVACGSDGVVVGGAHLGCCLVQVVNVSEQKMEGGSGSRGVV